MQVHKVAHNGIIDIYDVFIYYTESYLGYDTFNRLEKRARRMC
jgi:hypothetical protein